jgi:phosphoheptose isomerase
MKRGYCSHLKDAIKNRKAERMLTILITGAAGGMLKELFNYKIG